jgi:predicted O-linked N-acetylglucosamine transferase (SPINDLY family)
LDDPALQRKAALIYLTDQLSEAPPEGERPNRDPAQKIRIGYYSSDFHNHATAHLMAELLASHDRQKFEVWGFSFGPDRRDAMRQRLAQTFDRFIDVHTHSDHEVAQLSRAMGVDIAVDLKGLTGDARTGIFAHRCAPLQVNFLGYPGTMALPCIDYIVADKVLIPPESQKHYSEKVVYLPHSYQVNDSQRKIADQRFTRAELGLPEQGFVFCCFNNNYKIQPQTFDIWMRLLHAVPGSVLWLFEDNPTAAKNLRLEADHRGVDPARLVFAQRMQLPEHLARHRLADVFLDTLPYNAHTTASDALWAGLPVLTLIGQSFAARVAASLLQAMDLPELITHSEAEYESKALALARQPEQLQALKSKIERQRKTSPLFKGQLFAKHLEAAYEAMLERHRAGLAPDHIFVAT